MKKYISVIMFAVIIILLIIGMFAGILVVKADADQDYPLKIWMQNENGRFMTLNVIDENTGVNYIVVAAESIYGDHTTSVAITPRLNADGSLYVSK